MSDSACPTGCLQNTARGGSTPELHLQKQRFPLPLTAAAHALPARFLHLELFDTSRVGSVVNWPPAAGALPASQWQQGALLVSNKQQPRGTVPAPLQFNVTPSDVQTDVTGA